MHTIVPDVLYQQDIFYVDSRVNSLVLCSELFTRALFRGNSCNQSLAKLQALAHIAAIQFTSVWPKAIAHCSLLRHTLPPLVTRMFFVENDLDTSASFQPKSV